MKREVKKYRDRMRFEKYGGMELVKELILELPEKPSYSKGHVLETATLIASRKIKRKTKQKYFLAETIVKQAVGKGFLRFRNGRYFLTKKAAKLLEKES